MWSYETPTKTGNWKERSQATTNYKSAGGSYMLSGRLDAVSKLSRARRQTRTLIDDLINGVESKRKVCRDGIRSVGNLNMELLDALNDGWNKQATTTTFYKKPKKQEGNGWSFHESLPLDQPISELQSLRQENSQLKHQLSLTNRKIWDELQELKEENEYLRSDTTRLLAKNSRF